MASPEPVGVVLAGGASSRFGTDKALQEIDGLTLTARAAELLDGICEEVILADRGRELLPGRASVADGPGAGPAAAVLGAHRARPERRLLVLACDLPAVPRALLNDLAASEADLALPRWQRGFEPLVALFGLVALRTLGARVARGRLSLHALASLEGLSVETLEGRRLTRHGEPDDLFANLNTPEALSAYLSRARR